MIELNDRAILHAPELFRHNRDGIFIALDPESPNWIAADERGDFILQRIDGKRPLADLTREYLFRYPMDAAKGWLHVHDFLQAAVRQGLVSRDPVERAPYAGRARHLTPDRLREFWIHTNNSCNLTCTHCLVSS
ncbi:MAG: PqqD family protein, partial [Nitrospirae bacterium]|nr:PqqD family protein [Nitrospirota bacterium]